MKNIVLVGAGHAHLVALAILGRRPIPQSKITLISRARHTAYSGMLPGLIAGRYSFEDAHIDAASLCDFARAEFHRGEVTGIDPARKQVTCGGGRALPFDVLSIDIGSAPNMAGIAGAAEFAIPVRPTELFLSRFDLARQRLREGRFSGRVAVVGGGAGGCELMLSLAFRLRREALEEGCDPSNLGFVLMTDKPDILTDFPAKARRRFREICASREIEVRASTRIIKVCAEGMTGASGEFFPADAIFWVTEGTPPHWLSETGLAADCRGLLRVHPTLESITHPSIFAAGDVARIEGFNLPRSGVYAVRQGPILAENLRRAAAGLRLRRYRPQKNALYLISTGDARAIGTRNGLVFEGGWVWRLKDWIDRRFVRNFNSLGARD